MTISAATGYMSNDEIMAWMQTRTEQLYTNMRDEMSGADERANAEQALDQIKAMLANNSGKDASQVAQLINDTMAKYSDIPDVAQVLQPIKDKFDDAYQAATDKANAAKEEYRDLDQGGELDNPLFALKIQDLKNQMTISVTVDKDDADSWGKQIDDTVQNLGKQDSLDMIKIQELNSEINQAKQTASALMDAADKSAEATINHIS